MQEALGFIDIKNSQVLELKEILNSIVPDECVKVPAGYALNFGNVQVALTRHAFTLSLEGRIILEENRTHNKWDSRLAMQRLGVDRLVEFQLDDKDLRMVKHCVDSRFGDVCIIPNTNRIVGGFLGCLILIDNLKQTGFMLTDTKAIRFTVPLRDGFEAYYIANTIPMHGFRYYLVRSNAAVRSFVKTRLGLTQGSEKEINTKTLLRSAQVINADYASENESYESMYDPIFCLAVRELDIRGLDITEKVCVGKTMRCLPAVPIQVTQADSEFDAILGDIV